ncbi:MAG: GNAT family N-acyltransferase [Burkholderiaceae bacterium]
MSIVPTNPSILPACRQTLARVGRFDVRLASSLAEVEQAQALRYQVFVEELGARPASHGRDRERAIERDAFDPYCEHLIARDLATGRTVGTYRVLLPERARELGCLYSEREFWLTRIDRLRPRMVELGRSCVAADYRNGTVIRLLWAGLAAFLGRHDVDYLIGCASVSLDDGGAEAAGLYRQLAVTHLADESFRVWPRRRLPVDAEAVGAMRPIEAPALIKAYLRAGAWLLGEPHHDEAFACADFPMMLELGALTERYRRRFGLGEASLAA